jgi:putative DNA primase/helicase
MADLNAILGHSFTAAPKPRATCRHEAVSAFISAMQAEGVRPLESISSRLLNGGIVRFRSEGDKPGRANAWALFSFDPVPHGTFGSWRLMISKSWNGSGIRILSDLERRKLKISIDAAREEAASRELNAAIDADNRWSMATAVDPHHGYLVAKNMTGEGLRQQGNLLLVPMRDLNGRLWNLQRIAPDGAKRFLKGGRVKGLLWMPVMPKRSICIGEGVATMAAVRAATELPVAAAMSANNLLIVSQAIHSRWPEFDIIVCADDDASSAENTGVIAAMAAAEAVGGRLAIPPRRSSDV